jgi:hypothetical protein
MSNDSKKNSDKGQSKSLSDVLKKAQNIGESKSHSEQLRRGAEIVPRPNSGNNGKKNK